MDEKCKTIVVKPSEKVPFGAYIPYGDKRINFNAKLWDEKFEEKKEK